jgi:hypothetical protein
MAHGLLLNFEYDQAALVLFGKTTGLTHEQHEEVMAYIAGDTDDYEDLL